MNLKSPSRSKFLDPGRIFCTAVTCKVNTFSWWLKWHWLSHQVVYCKMVNLMLSGFVWGFLKDDICWAVVTYSRLQKVKGVLTWQMVFHCGFDALDRGYWFSHENEKSPEGNARAGAWGANSLCVRLSSLCPSQKMQSEGIQWKEHLLFIRLNYSFPERPTDERLSGLASESCSK